MAKKIKVGGEPLTNPLQAIAGMKPPQAEEPKGLGHFFLTLGLFLTLQQLPFVCSPCHKVIFKKIFLRFFAPRRGVWHGCVAPATFYLFLDAFGFQKISV